MQQIQKVVALSQDESNDEPSDAVTSIAYKDLKEKLETGQLAAYDLVNAYRRKAAALHKELNCLTGFIQGALEQAKVNPTVANC